RSGWTPSLSVRRRCELIPRNIAFLSQFARSLTGAAHSVSCPLRAASSGWNSKLPLNGRRAPTRDKTMGKIKSPNIPVSLERPPPAGPPVKKAHQKRADLTNQTDFRTQLILPRNTDARKR